MQDDDVREAVAIEDLGLREFVCPSCKRKWARDFSMWLKCSCGVNFKPGEGTLT